MKELYTYATVGGKAPNLNINTGWATAGRESEAVVRAKDFHASKFGEAPTLVKVCAMDPDELKQTLRIMEMVND
jgi:hypothetical protein